MAPAVHLRLVAGAGALLLGALPAGLPAQQAAPPPDDQRVRQAWSVLLPAEQRDAVLWLEVDTEHLDTFQMVLVRHALSLLDQDPGTLPDAEPAPCYDPRIHAPGQPIPRRRLDPESRLARRTRERILARVPVRRLRSGWRYDWGRRRIERSVERGSDDAQRVFENALAGFAPGLDLAEAIVESRLDDGSHSAVLAAFGHAYTDREGRVFPGITLYRAHDSGLEIEMPDVDCLGIVHDLLDDWGSWVAPVPANAHDELYSTLGRHFVQARRYLGPRRALARLYLTGTPVIEGGYDADLDGYHALWEAHASDPDRLVRALPSPEGWTAFLETHWAGLKAEPERFLRGQERRRALEEDALRVRARLVAILTELGAFERRARPEPPEPPPRPGEAGGSGGG